MLSGASRRARVVAMLVVFLALAAGTVAGDDDDFPFGPFKMYAGTAHLNDPVPVMRFEGVTDEGETLPIESKEFGLRPAEVEGRLEEIASDPDLLRDIVASFERMEPKGPSLAAFRVKHGVYDVENGRPVGYHEEVLAEWKRP
jgi:hypothetical protein